MSESVVSKTERPVSRRRFLQGAAAVLAGTAAQAALPAGLVRAGWNAIASPVGQQSGIDVTAYGAVGDGATNDREAFQKAINAAIGARKPLIIPQPGQFYRISLDLSHPQLDVAGNLTLAGAGRRASTIRFDLAQSDGKKVFSGFYVHNGAGFTMTDLRLEEVTNPRDFEFQGVYLEPGPADQAALLERVDILGFTNCIYVPASGVGDGMGELSLTLRDCDIQPDYSFCIAFWAVENGHKRLHMYDCYLHDNKDSHLVYCHPHNSVHVENCRFDGATAWAFHFQGSAVGGNPEYQRFIGCWFGAYNSRGIITQDRETVETRPEIRNCIFECRPAIQIRSNVLIDGCYFTTPQTPPWGQTFISAYSNAPWQAEISNCIFAPKADSLPMVDLRLENIEATVRNCQFFNQATGTLLTLGNGPNNRYTISDCLFYNRLDNAASSVALEINNGSAVVERCRFIGRSHVNRGVIDCVATETGPGPEARLDVVGCTFYSVSGGSVFHATAQGANTWSERILGRENFIGNLQTGKPILTVTPEQAVVYGRIAPKVGRSPQPQPAGPILVINSNYDAYDVVGSADVAFVHWWYDNGLSDALFNGQITLTAAEGFALVNGGNVRLSGELRLVPAGDAVQLFYDPVQAVWVEMAGG